MVCSSAATVSSWLWVSRATEINSWRAVSSSPTALGGALAGAAVTGPALTRTPATRTASAVPALARTPAPENAASLSGTPLVRCDQRMPGHRRGLGQPEDIEEGRRDVGEP